VNYSRLGLATLGATAVYFVLGGLVFGLGPLRNEFQKYPAVYRTANDMKTVMPYGIFAMLLSMLVLAVLYAMIYRGGSGATEGARFGALIGLFAVGSFVLHNYVNLNIGLKLTLEQALAYFIQWTLVGLVIGLIYRPLLP
jgi:ABC-type Na+ efflux pump permease subunit